MALFWPSSSEPATEAVFESGGATVQTDSNLAADVESSQSRIPAAPDAGTDEGDQMPTLVPVAWTVADQASEKPLPEAILRIETDTGLHSLLADADGQIELDERVRAEDRLATVGAPGYCTRRVRIDARSEQPRRIGLVAATNVRFTVLWNEGCVTESDKDGFELVIMPQARRPLTSLDVASRISVRTDENGDAGVRLAAGNHELHIRSNGIPLQSTQITVTDAADALTGNEFTMHVPCIREIEVQVVDAETRAPVPGVQFEPADGLAVERVVESDGSGSAQLPIAEYPSGWLARKLGYADEKLAVTWRDPAVEPPQTVELARTVQVRGVLVGFGEDVTVTAFGTVAHLGRPTVVYGATTTAGPFTAEVRADEVVILFVTDGAGRWAIKEADPRKAIRGKLDVGSIEAATGLEIGGEVIGHEGAARDEGWSFVEVGVYRLAGPEEERFQIDLAKHRCAIDDKGQFRCTGLPSGEMVLRPIVGRAAGERLRRPLMTSDSSIVLRVGECIEGQVVLPSGAPAVGAGVIVRNAEGQPVAIDHADRSGTFQICGLLAGMHDVEVWMDDQEYTLEDVLAGTRDLRITFEPH